MIVYWHILKCGRVIKYHHLNFGNAHMSTKQVNFRGKSFVNGSARVIKLVLLCSIIILQQSVRLRSEYVGMDRKLYLYVIFLSLFRYEICVNK